MIPTLLYSADGAWVAAGPAKTGGIRDQHPGRGRRHVVGSIAFFGWKGALTSCRGMLFPALRAFLVSSTLLVGQPMTHLAAEWPFYGFDLVKPFDSDRSAVHFSDQHQLRRC